jgi:hypothetical protein
MVPAWTIFVKTWRFETQFHYLTPITTRLDRCDLNCLQTSTTDNSEYYSRQTAHIFGNLTRPNEYQV